MKIIKNYEIQKQIKHIMQNQLYGILATISQNYPYTSLLAFVSSFDLKDIYIATEEDSKKFQNIKNNQKVAFFIDNRQNNNEDISNACALTAFGTAEPIELNSDNQIEKSYLKRHPQLKSFIQSRDTLFVKVNVKSYYLVKGFQNVYVIEMDNKKRKS